MVRWTISPNRPLDQKMDEKHLNRSSTDGKTIGKNENKLLTPVINLKLKQFLLVQIQIQSQPKTEIADSLPLTEATEKMRRRFLL